MLNNEITKNVQDFYYEKIYPICPNHAECKGNSEDFPVNPKMSYIGREYGNNPNIPNVLFLSLDSGDSKPKYTTIDEIRNQTESDNILKYENNKHWFQTFNLTKTLLKPFLNDLINDENEVKPYFVHTNSAKCNQGKKGRRQADDVLFRNCKNFVTVELPLYKPNLVVTQGNRACDVLGQFEIIETINIETFHNSKNIKMKMYIRNLKGNNVIHIPMNHPSYYKGYWGQKKCLTDNIGIITQRLKSVIGAG